MVRCYVWIIALYGSETWILRKLEQKCLESFDMWCWRRMVKIKWSEKVTNEQVLDHIGEKRTLLNNILSRTANWIGHILRRNCLHDAIEGQMMEVKGVGRRRTQRLYHVRFKNEYEVWLIATRSRQVSNPSKALLPSWYDGTPRVI
jgi:hypothetical protein